MSRVFADLYKLVDEIQLRSTGRLRQRSQREAGCYQCVSGKLQPGSHPTHPHPAPPISTHPHPSHLTRPIPHPECRCRRVQPAIYVASLAAVEALRASEGGEAIIESVDVACGLSLGEYTALAFAGALR